MGTRRLLVKIATQFDGQGADKAKKSTDGLAGSFGKLGTVASGALVAAGAALAKFAAESVKTATQFEKGMAEVFTLLPGISQGAMGAMTEQAKQAAKEMGVLPSELLPALYDSLSAGIPPDNVFSFLEAANAAAVGGVTDIGTAVDGLSSVVNAYGQDVISVGEASDVMFTAVRLGKTNFEQLSNSLFNVIPTAASLGVSFQDVAQNLSALTAAGVPTSVATTQLRQAFIEASKSGTKLDQALRDLHGKGFADLIASGMTSSQIFLSLRESMPEQQFRDLFGSVEAANAALGITNDTAQGVIDSFTGVSGATDAAAETMRNTAAQVDKELAAAFEVLKITIGDELTPEVVEFKRALIDVIDVTIKTVGPTIRIIKTLNELAQKASSGQATAEDYKNALRDVSSESLDLIDALQDATKPVETMTTETLAAAEAAASYDQKLSNYITTANASTVATAAEAEAIRASAQARALAAGGNDELADKLAQVNNHLSEEEALIAAANAANAAYFDDLEDGTETVGGFTDAQRELARESGSLFQTLSESEGPLGLYYQSLEDIAGGADVLRVNQDSLNETMVTAAANAGASASQLAILKIATGELTAEQAEAIIKQVALEQTLANLGQQYANGDATLGEYMSAAQEAVREINNMTVEFDTSTGAVNTNNESIGTLIGTMGEIPSEIRTHISITSDPIPNLPTGAGSTGAGNQGTNAGVQARASGGPVNAGQPYIIGEEGPELFVPNVGGTVIANGRYGGYTDQSKTIINNYDPTAAAITGALVSERQREKINRFMGVE